MPVVVAPTSRPHPRRATALFLLISTACTGNASSAALSSQDNKPQALSASSASTKLAWQKDASLCVAATGDDNGAGLTLTPCSSSAALTATFTSSGQLHLAGKCLDVQDGMAKDGAPVQLWDCFDNNDNQLWSMADGQISWTGHTFCLDVKDGVSGPQAALQIWQCGGGNVNQQWLMQDSAPPPTTPSDSSNTTTPEAAPQPSAASENRGGCKRGVAADAGAALSLSAADLALLSPKVSWWYNWYLMPGDSAVAQASEKLNLDYVQMVSVSSTDFDALEKNMPPKARYLLTFNEPNFHSQANMTPQQAAALWPKIEAFADKHKLLIVSPAMNYCWSDCNVGNPFDWLDQFFAACPKCRVDHIAVHAYTCDVANLKSMSLDSFVKKYNRPLWLTEFDCADNGAIRNDVASQKTFMKAALAMLEAHPSVFRYAWFMARANGDWSNIALLDGAGHLTELGSYYLSLPQACLP